MKQYFKPYKLLLYFLSLTAFFLIGLGIAGIVDAGKNQGLAGGAIVFSYGLFFSFCALILSILLSTRLERKSILRINAILVPIIAILFGYFTWNYNTNIKPKRNKQQTEFQKHKADKTQGKTDQTMNPVSDIETKRSTHIETTEKKNSEQKNELKTNPVMGLGMFAPNLFENEILYFYDNKENPNSPIDSLKVGKNKNGLTVLIHAPAWFQPEHDKLDYGILFFKVKSETSAQIEVIVNKSTEKSLFLSKNTGRMLYWPAFLSAVHSVELKNSAQNIYGSASESSNSIIADYSFLKPLEIDNEWMHVALIDANYREKRKGWIRWKKNGQMLIYYTLLS